MLDANKSIDGSREAFGADTRYGVGLQEWQHEEHCHFSRNARQGTRGMMVKTQGNLYNGEVRTLQDGTEVQHDKDNSGVQEPAGVDYSALPMNGTGGLRRLAYRALKGRCSPVWIGNANKAQLIAALNGEINETADVNARFDAGNDDGLAAVIARAVQDHLNLQTEVEMDEERVRAIAREELDNIKPIKVELPSGEIRNIGRQHPLFPKLLKMLTSRQPHNGNWLNVFLPGPAGSGKTTGAHQAAKALGIPCEALSVSSQTPISWLFGFVDANSRYNGTSFRRMYEGGGIFVLDEIDKGNPNVLAALNSALDNGSCTFPDTIIARHEHFRCVATGNTYGNGPDRIYVGSNQLDGATLNRFVYLDWGYDEKLERQLADNDKWVTHVQRVRQAADQLKLKVIISPRASFFGAAMLANGMTWNEAEQACLWQGMAADAVTRVLEVLK